MGQARSLEAAYLWAKEGVKRSFSHGYLRYGRDSCRPTGPIYPDSFMADESSAGTDTMEHLADAADNGLVNGVTQQRPTILAGAAR
jgi:hypothetical protein